MPHVCSVKTQRDTKDPVYLHYTKRAPVVAVFKNVSDGERGICKDAKEKCNDVIFPGSAVFCGRYRYLHMCGAAGTALRLCDFALNQRNAKTPRREGAKDE
ncbi:MAG: hypothetical protein C5S47_02575 [Candidatus Methanogasteraceae archaeon]|nr:MAG: hypothetical protein C5S47_02575 [ANME-2 cluster archaeon]